MTDDKPTRGIATCRTCKRAFTKDGFGQQSIVDPKRCLDCYGRERAFAWQRLIDAQRGLTVREYATEARD